MEQPKINRADRRKLQHKSKPFAAIEAKRQLSHERNVAKRASNKLNRGNQFGGMTKTIAQPMHESYLVIKARETYGHPSLKKAA